MDKEYFNDPDLESILQGTELDTGKLTRFENEKLFLIVSVIYSERFELKGKRQKEVMRKLQDVMFRLRSPFATSPYCPFQQASPIPIYKRPFGLFQ